MDPLGVNSYPAYDRSDHNGRFCTLGALILDQIQTENTNPQLSLGGAGTYAALGARIVAGRDASESVAWIVDMGADFPSSLLDALKSWSTRCVFRLDTNRKTTRALLQYTDKNRKSFQYLTPKLHLDHNSLTSEQLKSAVFHLVCTSERGVHLTRGIFKNRGIAFGQRVFEDQGSRGPFIIWEPGSDQCVPGHEPHLRNLVDSCVDVFSPNSEEFFGYFKSLEGGYTVQRAAQRLLRWPRSKKTDLFIVVRQGSAGSCTYFRNSCIHLRPYYLDEDQGKVIDPTGAGNAFLGALGMAIISPDTAATRYLDKAFEAFGTTFTEMPRETIRLVKALIMATVVASFVLEQVGVPNLAADMVGTGRVDVWNDATLCDRLSVYMLREGAHIAAQAATPQHHKQEPATW